MKTLQLHSQFPAFKAVLRKLANGRPPVPPQVDPPRNQAAGSPSGRCGLRSRLVGLVACLGLLSPSAGVASPVFISSGEAIRVDSASGDVYHVQGGSLDILPGAEIADVGTSLDGTPSIRMSGGRVLHGISIWAGELDVDGGEVRGHDNPAFAGDGVRVFQGSARITAGTFFGGDSSWQAGSAVVSSAAIADGVPVIGSLFLGGGEFRGGTGAGGYLGGDSGYSLVSLGHTTVAGGLFLSPIAINAAYGGVTEFLGADLRYDSITRALTGTLRNGDPISARIYLSSARIVADPSGERIRFEPLPSRSPRPPPCPIRSPSRPRSWCSA